VLDHRRGIPVFNLRKPGTVQRLVAHLVHLREARLAAVDQHQPQGGIPSEALG